MNDVTLTFLSALGLLFLLAAAILVGPWRALAWLVTREKVFVWLLRRAFRTPYSHITSADGSDVYMRRYWLFNPYATEEGARASGSDAAPRRSWWREMLPSVRIHHIKRADQDRHLHDHPWNARTIVLKGWYEEERYADESLRGAVKRELNGSKPAHSRHGYLTLHEVRIAGYTGRLLFGQYHRITAVSAAGVWTLFITWRKRGSWGFDVDGVKVPWRDYLALAAMSKDIAELPIKVSKQPDPRMTERAHGATYETFKDAGWTDDMLVLHGYMHPPTNPTPQPEPERHAGGKP